MTQSLYTVLICVQFVVVALHDLIDIPGWTHGRQVRSALGPYKTLIGTLINSIFPGLAVAFALYYWRGPKPAFVLDYWIVYLSSAVISAITAWWIPYFFGANEKKKQLYAAMYAGTRQVLPLRGDNPESNVLHSFSRRVSEHVGPGDDALAQNRLK